MPLRVAAVSFVTKQKKPKIGLETKVSKNFLVKYLSSFFLLPAHKPRLDLLLPPAPEAHRADKVPLGCSSLMFLR